jgi:cell division protein FtsL
VAIVYALLVVFSLVFQAGRHYWVKRTLKDLESKDDPAEVALLSAYMK